MDESTHWRLWELSLHLWSFTSLTTSASLLGIYEPYEVGEPLGHNQALRHQQASWASTSLTKLMSLLGITSFHWCSQSSNLLPSLVPLDVPHFHQCGSQDHLQLSVQQEVFILRLGKAIVLLVAPYTGDSRGQVVVSLWRRISATVGAPGHCPPCSNMGG